MICLAPVGQLSSYYLIIAGVQQTTEQSTLTGESYIIWLHLLQQKVYKALSIFQAKNAIKLIADDATAGVHFCVKIPQLPQTRVYFGHFVNSDSYKIIPYILIKFIQINRQKNTLYIGGNLALIEQSILEQRHDKLNWFY